MLLVLLSVVAVASASDSSSTKRAAGTASQLYPPAGDDWLNSEGPLSGTRYSSLTQINKSNVKNLKVAWTRSLYPTKNYSSLGVESTPIEAAGVLYVPTTVGVDALDGVTGKTIWSYKGVKNRRGLVGNLLAARALSIGGGMVYTGQADGSITAVNTKTGHAVWTANVASVGTYAKKSQAISLPFTVYANGRHPDRHQRRRFALARAHRRVQREDRQAHLALVHVADPVRPGDQDVGQSGSRRDRRRRCLVDPRRRLETRHRSTSGTGNPFPYTGRTPGQNLWADSEVALDLKTGELKWGYQAVHHDEWDYDCPTPPILYDAKANGKMTPGVAFSCKSGYVYLLDRRNGEPIFPIPEVQVANPDNGEGAILNQTWPTQPIPSGGEAQILPHCPTAAQVRNVLPGKFPKAPNGDPYVLTCPYAPTNSTHFVVWGPYFAFGGTDYPPMSYSPQTNDLYVCANVTFQSTENVSDTDQSHKYETGGGWTTDGLERDRLCAQREHEQARLAEEVRRQQQRRVLQRRPLDRRRPGVRLEPRPDVGRPEEVRRHVLRLRREDREAAVQVPELQPDHGAGDHLLDQGEAVHRRRHDRRNRARCSFPDSAL